MCIKKSNNQFKSLMKLVLATTYNINLEDKNLNCINKVAKIYASVFRNIHL